MTDAVRIQSHWKRWYNKVRVTQGEMYQNMQIYANRVYSGTKLEGTMCGNMYVLKQSPSYLNRMTMNWSILCLWCGLPASTTQLFSRWQSTHHEFKLPSISESILHKFLYILNVQFLRSSRFNPCNNRSKKSIWWYRSTVHPQIKLKTRDGEQLYKMLFSNSS